MSSSISGGGGGGNGPSYNYLIPAAIFGSYIVFFSEPPDGGSGVLIAK